jgi:hypothetical protein
MSNEQVMTELYTKNAWGSQESRSGSTSTSHRTEQLRGQLPQFFSKFEIQSVLDCGCGDWTWMSEVDLTGIEYMGVDIVDPLLDYLQTKYTKPSIRFQKMDVMEDPSEKADVWFARDLLCLYPNSSYKLFFQRFLESDSKYIALSTVDTDEPNDPGILGIWRRLNLKEPPFALKHPVYILLDGKQWNRQKYMHVFTREQIQTWMDTEPFKTTVEALPSNIPLDTRDMNAYKLSNIPLRLRSMRDHMG